MRINLLLTFDYELPLGGIVKSFDHSLFSPTNQLLGHASKLGVPVVLFADILSYMLFKENNVKDYYQAFEEQLKQALIDGHDVQLHLHPHWLETKITEQRFQPSAKFRLSDFSTGSPHTIRSIIQSGVSELNAICQQVDPNYNCIAYRGGGYNLQPSTREILTELYAAGIRMDSSIAKGYYYASDMSLVDYRDVPNSPNWILSNDGDFSKTGVQGIYEIPIATRSKGIFELPTAVKLKFTKTKAPEARGPMMHTSNATSTKQRINQMMASRMLTIDNYTYSASYLIKIFDDYIRRNKEHDELSFCLIGHPKSMGDHAYMLLEALAKHARKKYNESVHFSTYPEVFKRISNI